MARYTGPACKLCRREGKKLFLKGDRCYTSKCALERRSYAPGQHGQNRKKVGKSGESTAKKKVYSVSVVIHSIFKSSNIGTAPLKLL